MFRYILMLIGLLVFMTGCSLKKADIDFDPAFDIGKLETFNVNYKSSDALASLNQERISEAIKNEIVSKGYINRLNDGADFSIKFETSAKIEFYPNTSLGFGIGTFSRRMAVSMGNSYDVTQERESLNINMIDTKTNKIFWSSLLIYDTYETKSPKERIEYFNKIVSRMLEEFPSRLVQSKK